ncbi:MAG: glycosyltransferase family 4 protein [candidate division Zixibacteria bacterium]|nr:glycosyltransferase family 4 protein [candidate division Zixibacteria bacterium]
MRILVVNWRDIRHPEAGGAEAHVHEVFSRIVQGGHDVTLLCSVFPGAPHRECIDGIDVVRHGGKFTFNLTVPGFYRSHLAENRYDIIVEALNKIPFFLSSQIDKPVLAILYHLFGLTVFLETNPVFASYVYLTERLIPLFYRRCRFESISESSKEELVDMGISDDRMDVVHSGLDWSRFQERGGLHEKTAPIILYVSRLKRYKNVHHAILAMPRIRAAVPNARLVVVGDGDYRSALETLARKTGVQDAVTFTGFVPTAEKVAWYRRAMVGVYPSSKEGWGLTVIEANACYTPMVATRVPGLKDAIVDGRTGLLTPPRDIEALADALIRVLQDRPFREHLATEAAQWADRFTWEATAEKTLRLLEQTIEEFRAA